MWHRCMLKISSDFKDVINLTSFSNLNIPSLAFDWLYGPPRRILILRTLLLFCDAIPLLLPPIPPMDELKLFPLTSVTFGVNCRCCCSCCCCCWWWWCCCWSSVCLYLLKLVLFDCQWLSAARRFNHGFLLLFGCFTHVFSVFEGRLIQVFESTTGCSFRHSIFVLEATLGRFTQVFC